MNERDFDKGYKSGFKFGKEVANEEWMNKIKQAREEIKGKAFTEEIFDEDIFNSTNTESVSIETAECESYVETEVVKLSEVLAILDKQIESEGVNEPTRTLH